jgi:hypothetical protein
MTFLKMTAVAVAMAAGIGGASAATFQNSRGTFIQDRHGAWHQYVRVSQRRSLARVYASADYGAPREYLWLPQVRRSAAYYGGDDYGTLRQYYQVPRFQSSIGFNGQDEFAYGASAQDVMGPQGRYSGGFYANEGYNYPVAYLTGSPASPDAGISSQR